MSKEDKDLLFVKIPKRKRIDFLDVKDDMGLLIKLKLRRKIHEIKKNGRS